MHTKLISRFATGSILSALALTSTYAVDRSWSLSGTGNFADGANWNPSFVGAWSAADTAAISNGGTATVSLGDNLSVGQIWVGQNATSTPSTGTLNQTGGSITLTDGLVVGRQGSAVGVYNMTGGTISGLNLRLGGGTLTSEGTMNISGIGTILTTNQTGTSGVVGIGVPGKGTMTLSNGAVWNNTNSTVVVVGGDNNAINQNVAGTGVLNINSNAAVNLTGGGNMAIGRNTGTGTVTINGGSLNLQGTGTINMGNAFANAGTGTQGGNGTLTLNSGSLTAFRINMTIAQNKSVGSGTAEVKFNGGTATIGGMGKGDGTANVHFNGTQIVASETNADFYTGFAGSNLDIQSGGQNLNTNTHDVGITQGMTGVGGLTKSGDGTLTLSGANVYAGATVVQAGTLLVSGSVGGSSLSVQNGGSLSLQNFSSLNDAIVLNLFTGSTVNLNFAGTETIGILSLNGSNVAPGTYTLAALQGLGGGAGVSFGGDSNALVTVAAIPEPSTIALLGLAGVAIAARIRRARLS